MRKKILVGCAAFFLMICSAGISALAHSGGTTFNNYGSESTGWVIRTTHHNANRSLTYKYDSADACMSTTLYRNMTANGAAKWAPCGTISYNSTSNNTITTINDKNAGFTAQTGNYAYNTSTLHTSRYTITINRYHHSSGSDYDTAVVSHEFGHAFGLLHVLEDRNKNAIMYGNGVINATARRPATKDANGLSNIANGN